MRSNSCEYTGSYYSNSNSTEYYFNSFREVDLFTVNFVSVECSVPETSPLNGTYQYLHILYTMKPCFLDELKKSLLCSYHVQTAILMATSILQQAAQFSR